MWSVGSVVRSVLCRFLGTDTHHFPGGAASTQLGAQTQAGPRAAPAFCCCPAGSCGMSWLPAALTFVSLPSPPSDPSQHTIPGENLHTREGSRMQLEEQLKCCFTAAPIRSSALPRASSTAAEGGRGACKRKWEGKVCAGSTMCLPMAPQQSPGAGPCPTGSPGA